MSPTLGRIVWIFALFGSFVALLYLAWGGVSADLRATWLAGEFYSFGAYDQVYPSYDTLFTMLTPEQWRPHMLAQDPEFDKPLYPYLYPPIWAAIASWGVPHGTFEAFSRVMGVINVGLLMGMALLAWRAATTQTHALGHLVLVLIALVGGVIGGIALMENQPQIFVSFLLVLVVERESAGKPYAAGAVLALAAALKVYPALFAILWLATKNWRALTGFAVVGGALAATSVGLAGWPLHAEFLHLLGQIGKTAMINSINFSWDTLLAQLGVDGPLTHIVAAHVDPEKDRQIGWFVVEKSEVRIWSTRLAMVLGLVLIGRTMCRVDASTRATLLWPLAFLVVAFFGPITWSYSYLPAFAFLPLLRDHFGASRGLTVMILIAAPFSFPIFPLWPDIPGLLSVRQAVGTVTIAAFMAVLWTIIGPARHASQSSTEPQAA